MNRRNFMKSSFAGAASLAGQYAVPGLLLSRARSVVTIAPTMVAPMQVKLTEWGRPIRDRTRLRIFALAILILAVARFAPGESAAGFRADRVSLNGIWKFQLRHDNQLTTDSAVHFGPVSASSQATALFWQDMPEGTLDRPLPWGLAATLLGPSRWPLVGGLVALVGEQVWKPDPRQAGPTWWRADFGMKESLAMVRIHWTSPGGVAIVAEVSSDSLDWTVWAEGAPKSNEAETALSGQSVQARFLRLNFVTPKLAGIRGIEVYFRQEGGRLERWQPVVQRTWYDELRRFSPADGFHGSEFVDNDWSTIRVPGYWEPQGFGKPTWNQSDDAVGYYRRTFTVPAGWRGRRVRLRFEGVNNSAQVWLNGTEVGYHESGWTPFEYDVTPNIHFGAENLIAVRVCKWTLTHEYDTGDFYFLGGIWRDVYLYSLPSDHIEDYTLRTEFDPQYRDALLRADVKLKTGEPLPARTSTIEGRLFDQEGKEIPLNEFKAEVPLAGRDSVQVSLVARVPDPHKWTAETPYLYSLGLCLKVDGRVSHEFRTPVGFRQVELKGNQFLLNSVPLKLHGVATNRANPSDSDEPPEKLFAREIRLLKEANINAIRTHTVPVEEEFLDLCDRFGIYVIPDVPYVEVNENDFRYLTEEALLRAREIYEKHKNHPSVLLWHVGNENGESSAYLGMGQVGRWLHTVDLTRPLALCLNQANPAELGAQIEDIHYRPLRYESFRAPAAAPVLFAEFHSVPNEAGRLRDLGFTESWGRDLQREWAEFEKRPWVVGGMICCWEDGAVRGDQGASQWGVVDSKRRAKLVHQHIRKVFCPLDLSLVAPPTAQGRLKAALKVTDRYSFTDLQGFRFLWQLRKRGETVASGEISCQARPQSTVQLPLPLDSAAEAEKLRVEVFDPLGYSIQEEEFYLPTVAGPSSVSEILRRIGITETPALSVKEGSTELRAARYGAHWGAPPQVEISSPKGEKLFTIDGFVMEAEESGWSLIEVASIRHGSPTTDRNALTIPFTVAGKLKRAMPWMLLASVAKEERSWTLEGSLRIEFGTAFVRVSYTLKPSAELLVPELGIGVRLGSANPRLGWNREALWSSLPPTWADGPLEEGIPLEVLRETGSKRGIFWAQLSSGEGSILLIPMTAPTNLRIGTEPNELVVSDFLSAGDFLGKFDSGEPGFLGDPPVLKRLAGGEQFTGGFTLYFLNSKQARTFHGFSSQSKDLGCRSQPSAVRD